jgi:hypothetical protein
MASDFVKKFRLLLEADSTGAVTGLHEVGAAADGATPKLSLADKAAGKLGISTAAMGAALTGVAVAGAGAIAKFALDGAKKFGELGESVQKFAFVAGTTNDVASRFVAVADDYGVGADTIATAVGKLGKGLGANVTELDKFGVAVAKTKTGQVDLAATTFNVIDALNATNDAAKRDALGTAAFGKGWQELIPLIEQGSTKIKASFSDVSKAQLFDDNEIKKAQDYRLAMDDIHDSVRDLSMSIGQDLVPVIKDAAGAMDLLSGKGHGVFDALTFGLRHNPFANISDLVDMANPKVQVFIDELDTLNRISGPLSDNLNLVAEADKKGVTYTGQLTDSTQAQNDADRERIAQTDRLVKSYQDQLDAVDKLRKGIEDEVSAALDANSAHLSSVDADQRVTDAIAHYNEMLRGTPPNLDDVAKAQDRLTKAKEKYNDSLKVTPASDLDKEKAQIALAEAQLAYTDSIQHPGRAPDLERRKATISLTEAQMAYDKVIKGSSASADEQAAALQDVTDAQKDYDATTRTVIHSEQDKKTAYEDVQRAINDSASTHAAEQEILKKEAGLSWNVRDSLDAQVTSLTNIEKTLAPGSALAVAVDAHIQQLKDQAAAADAAVASLNIYNGVPGGGAAGYGARVAPGGGLPHYATGGTVPGPVGQSMLALVHGGERVVPVGAPTNSAAVPSSWSGGGGTTSYSWTINVAPGTDTIAFGRIIEQARRDFLKAGGQAA